MLQFAALTWKVKPGLEEELQELRAELLGVPR
jgi:hypothetical protein